MTKVCKQVFLFAVGENRRLLILGSLLFGGIVLRLFAWRLLPSVLIEDAGNYNEIAINLLNTGRYYGSEGLAFRPPLQSFFIFLVYKIFGVNSIFASAAQVLVSSLTAILVWKITKFFFGERTGLMAFFLSVFSFDLALFAPLLMSETFFTFLLVAGFWFLAITTKTNRPLLFYLTALVFGISTLAKPTVLPVFILILILFWRKVFFKQWLVITIALFLVLLPVLLWSWRNFSIFKQPIFVATNGGINFYIGNNPDATGSYDKNTEKLLTKFEGKTEIDKNNSYFREGLAFISVNPIKTLINVVKKPFYLLATFGGSAEGLIVRKKSFFDLAYGLVQVLSYWLVLFGSIYFFFIGGKKLDKKVKLLVLLMLFFCIGYIVSLLPFFTFPRFRIPLLPLLIIFGSFGLDALMKKINFRKLILTIIVFTLLIVRDWSKILFFLIKLSR